MEKELFETILSESGIVAGLLFFSNVVWIWMFMWERKDRRAAWKANNDFKKEVIEAMKEVVPILAVLKDRSDRR